VSSNVSNQRGFPAGIRVLLLALAYVFCDYVGDWLSFDAGNYTGFSLPAGLLLGALLLSPPRRWLLFVLAALPSGVAFDLWRGHSFFWSSLCHGGNGFEALAGAWLMHRFVSPRPRLDLVWDTRLFIGVCAVGVPAVMATVAALLTVGLRKENFALVWGSWWSGNMAGILVAAPVLLAWAGKLRSLFSPGNRVRVVEIVIAFSLSSVAAWFVAFREFHGAGGLKFLVFPFFGWIANRFGTRGVSVFSLILAGLIAQQAALQTDGVSVLPLSPERTLVLQVFVAVASFSGLLLAALWSERRQGEEKLRGLSDRWVLATRAANVGIWDNDLVGNHVVWDESMHRLYGTTPETFEPSYENWQSRIHPEDRAQVHQEVQFANSGKKEYDTEFRVVWPDQSVHYIKAIGQVQRDAAGRAVRILGTNWDISSLKKAEAALRESERRLASFFKGATAGLILVSRDLRIVQINETLAAIDGLSVEQHLGRTIREVLPQMAPALEPLVQRVLATGEVMLNVELSGETAHAPGVERHWAVSFFPVADVEGKNEGVGSFVMEITDRKRLEARLRQAQKMEAVGQLAGGIAHDFNNILAAMVLNLDLIRTTGPEDADTRLAVAELAALAQRAARLIRQLLMFGHQSVMQVAPLNLDRIIEDVLKMLTRLLGEHIQVEYRPHGALPSMDADAGMMEQVLVNLAVNARDAMPNGGRLTIVTTVVDLTPEAVAAYPDRRPGRFISLSVSDTGCGMDQATLRKIFEPFFTTKEIGKGTGLGLATVYGIVKQHQGWIEVQSQPGQGSTFRVLLPAGSAASKEPAAHARAEAPRGGTETLLLVEDEPALRRVLAQYLRRLGYEVLEAASGKEALQLWPVHRSRIKLLFTDMIMSEGLTGKELGDLLRNDAPSLKVIISSGYNAEMAAGDTFRKSGIVYLPKPVQTAMLGAIVRACLDRS